MTKEYKYKNESEDYELNDSLTKNEFRATEANRETLRDLAELEKIETGKETLTSKDYDRIIKNTSFMFEKKEKCKK